MYLNWTTNFMPRILFMSIFNTPFNQNFHSTKVTTIMLIWCLKHVKDFIFTFSMIQQVEVFFQKNNFWICIPWYSWFFSFRLMCWWDCWQLGKLSRIETYLFLSVSHTDGHPFHEWCRILSDYQKNYFWCMHLFKPQLMM